MHKFWKAAMPIVVLTAGAAGGTAASAKTAVECQKDYQTQRAAHALAGQSQKSFIKACLAAAPVAEAAPVPPAANAAAATADATADDASKLAEKLQNPVGDLISVPFQSNTTFNAGPHNGTQEVLNIQPVIPFHVTPDWNVITRTILPLVWSPSYAPAPSVPFGTAPTTFSAFLSPSKPTADGWVWGVGPVAQLPTASNASLGSNVWGLGPAAVVVRIDSPWVYGVLVNNVFSLGGTAGPRGNDYSVMTINPFVNYNFAGGWFIGSNSVITANWQAPGTKWTVPVGMQGGRLIRIGKLPVNLAIGAYYNVVRPNGVGDWTLRTQVALVF